MFRRFGTSRLAQEVKYSSIRGAPSAKTVWEATQQGPREFGFRRSGNKRAERRGLQTALDCMGTFYCIIPLELGRYYFEHVASGESEAFSQRGEFIVKAEPCDDRRRGISETTRIAGRRVSQSSGEMLHSGMNSARGTMLAQQERWQV